MDPNIIYVGGCGNQEYGVIEMVIDLFWQLDIKVILDKLTGMNGKLTSLESPCSLYNLE